MAPERRRRYLYLVLALFLIIYMFINCGGGRENFDIDVNGAAKMIGAENPPAVIDVRTPEEYVGELGHITGSRLIPIDTFRDSIEALSNLKDSTIIVVCKVGYRSEKAARLLLDNGFGKVYNLDGGMMAWNDAGEKIER
jgi:rhodanese-related sulfurtransferase